VGSGLGKLVLHMSVVTGCIASGIEILSNRVNLANEFRDKLVSQMKIPDWIMQTTRFVKGNAAT
jgi:predicted ATP-grasp superfamily ATP-dependent carboligase